jgi:hypothetical protein
MSVKAISSFLERFKNLSSSDAVVKKIFVEASEKINIKLTNDDIRIQGGVIYVKAGAGIKSRLFMHKKSLLEDMASFLGKRAPKDIR